MTRSFVAAVLAGALVAAGHAQTQSAVIQGRVVSADSGDALPHARVVIYNDATPLPAIFTDGQGQFTSPPVAIGRYRLTVRKAGYATTNVSGIDLAAGAPLSIRLPRAAAISGRVIDRFGEPAAGVTVQLTQNDGKVPAVALKVATTDDVGEYRFGGLTEGSYLVMALVLGIDPATGRNMRDATYFPGVKDIANAQPLALQPGDERTGVDFQGLDTQQNGFTVNSQIVLQNQAIFMAGAPNTPLVPKPIVGNGVIRGTVTRGDGLPLAHASVSTRVMATLPGVTGNLGNARPLQQLVYTDENGRYEFAELPAGRYRITAAKLGYTTTVYGQRPEETRSVVNQPSGAAVELAEGQIKIRIDMSLPRYSAITGRVIDDFGDPVEDVTVAVSEIRFEAGRRRLTGVAGITNRSTDDLGRYRLYGLLPGQYIVNAAPGQVLPNQPASDLSGYAPSYFPGTPSAREAQLVPVGRSQDATGVDFVLVPTPTATISGKKLGSDGQPLGGSLLLMESQRSGAIITPPAGARIWDDGRFEFPNVAPGDYVIQADRGTNGPGVEGDFAWQYVTINGTDVRDLLLQSDPGSTIAGRVVFDGDGPAPSVRTLSVVPERADLDRDPKVGSIARGDVAQDLTFHISAVHGPRRINIERPPDGWDLKAVLANGVEVTDAAMRFGTPDQSISDLQILLTNRLTEITGTVTDSRGDATRDYTLLIFPQDRERWYAGSRYFRRARPEPGGYVVVRGLPPGDYYLAPVSGMRVLQEGVDGWQDPDFLESIAQRATRTTLTEGQKLSISAKVITP